MSQKGDADQHRKEENEFVGPWLKADVRYEGKIYRGKVAKLRFRPGYYGVKWPGGLYSEAPRSYVTLLATENRDWPTPGSWISYLEEGREYWGRISTVGRIFNENSTKRYNVDWIPADSRQNTEPEKKAFDLIWSEKGTVWRQFDGEPPWPLEKEEVPQGVVESKEERRRKLQKPELPRKSDRVLECNADEAAAREKRLQAKSKVKAEHPDAESSLKWLDSTQRPTDMHYWQLTFNKLNETLLTKIQVTRNGVVQGFGVVAKQDLSPGDTLFDPGAIFCTVSNAILDLEDSHHFIRCGVSSSRQVYKIHAFDREEPHRVASTFYLNEARGCEPNIFWSSKFKYNRHLLQWNVLKPIKPGEELLVIYDESDQDRAARRKKLEPKLPSPRRKRRKKSRHTLPNVKPSPSPVSTLVKKELPLQEVSLPEPAPSTAEDTSPAPSDTSESQMSSLPAPPRSLPPPNDDELPLLPPTSSREANQENREKKDDFALISQSPHIWRQAPLIIHIDSDSDDDDDDIVFLGTSSKLPLKSSALLDFDALKNTTDKNRHKSISFARRSCMGSPFPQKRRASDSAILKPPPQLRRGEPADIIVIDDSDDDASVQQYCARIDRHFPTAKIKTEPCWNRTKSATPTRRDKQPEIIIIDDDD